MSNAAHRRKRIRTWTRPCLAVVALIAGSALSSCKNGYFWFEPEASYSDYELDQMRRRWAVAAEEKRRDINEVFRKIGEERQPGLDSYSGYTF